MMSDMHNLEQEEWKCLVFFKPAEEGNGKGGGVSVVNLFLWSAQNDKQQRNNKKY